MNPAFFEVVVSRKSNENPTVFLAFTYNNNSTSFHGIFFQRWSGASNVKCWQASLGRICLLASFWDGSSGTMVDVLLKELGNKAY